MQQFAECPEWSRQSPGAGIIQEQHLPACGYDLAKWKTLAIVCRRVEIGNRSPNMAIAHMNRTVANLLLPPRLTHREMLWESIGRSTAFIGQEPRAFANWQDFQSMWESMREKHSNSLLQRGIEEPEPVNEIAVIDGGEGG